MSALMPENAEVLPAVRPPLDPGFRPMYLALRGHGKAAATTGAILTLALERNAGAVSRFSMPIFPDQHPRHRESVLLAERVLKLLLWQRGGHRVSVAGSASIAAHLADCYGPGGARAFDAEIGRAHV